MEGGPGKKYREIAWKANGVLPQDASEKDALVLGKRSTLDWIREGG